MDMMQWLSLGISVIAVLMASGLAWWCKRRKQAVEALLEAQRQHLSRVTDSFRQELHALHLTHQDFADKLDQLENALVEVVERQQQLAAEPGENKIYTRAVKMVELGASLEEIMEECDLPRPEAELILRLHRQP